MAHNTDTTYEIEQETLKRIMSNTTDSKQDEALDLVDAPERVTLWICCHCQTPRQVGLTVCDHCHKRLHDTVEYTRSRASVPAVGEDARLDEIRKRLELKEAGPTWYSQQEHPLRDAIMDARYLMIALERAERRAAASSSSPAEPPPSIPIPHDTQRCPECRELICAWANCISHNQHKPHGPLQPESEQETRS